MADVLKSCKDSWSSLKCTAGQSRWWESLLFETFDLTVLAQCLFKARSVLEHLLNSLKMLHSLCLFGYHV